jgi:hypothetical protein
LDSSEILLMAAYADPIDILTPDGADKRKFGDDNIREFKRAVRERLASIFVDIDSDPLVLKPGVITSGMLVDALILTAKIADLNVTTGKLADRVVTGIKLGLAAVIDEHIGAGLFNFDDVNSTAGYQVAGAAAVGKYLKGDGVHFVPGDILAADIPDALLQKLIMHLDGWYITNVPATSASFLTRYFNALGSGRNGTVMTQAGEIRKVWVYGEAARTAGSFTVKVSKNGVDTAAAAVMDAANPQTSIAAIAAGAVAFAAGDLLGFNWVTAGFAPNNTTHIAGFEARYT